MKAIRTHGRGGPEQLFYEDAPVPSASRGDAIVSVYATGITPAELTWTETYRNPDGSDRIPGIPGHEVSGVVQSIADGVSGISAGDEVYGLTDFPRDGAAAEYVAVSAANLAPKPRSLDHCQAAAVPLSALTAWQALFQHGQLAAGQRVLVHGAAGGVGVFAVQLAHWRGAHVIATASPDNGDLVRHLGADEVIDYKSVRFEDQVRDIDLVLDTVGGETRDRSWTVLREGGVLITLTAPFPEGKGPRNGKRGVFFVVQPSRQMLMEISELIDGKHLEPVVSEVLPLSRAREAFEIGTGNHKPGKIVLKVRDCT